MNARRAQLEDRSQTSHVVILTSHCMSQINNNITLFTWYAYAFTGG